MLSDTPPERDIEWTESGVEGAWRFIQRLWRLVHEAIAQGETGEPSGATGEALALRRAAHKALAAVTGDLSALRFNRAIARVYELANALTPALQSADKPPELRRAIREAAELMVLMSAPMMPHLAEECWSELGHQVAVVDTPWPTPDAALIAEDEVTIAVQVNGKRRDEVRLAKGLEKSEVVLSC